MAVVNGQPVNSAITNAAFLSRLQDSDTVGIVGLASTDIDSGNSIINLQRAVNKAFTASGILTETDATSNDYTEQNYITNGNTYKLAIDKLDIQLKASDTSIVDHIASTLAHAGTSITFANGQFTAIELSSAIIEAWKNAIGLKGYISDSAYESANGVPTGGEIFYETTNGIIRYYDSVAVEWADVGSGGGGIGAQETIGTGNDVTVDFTVSNIPTNEGGLQVYLNGVLVDKADYTFLHPTITFNTAPSSDTVIIATYLTDGTPSGPIPSTGTWHVETRTITAGEETAKQLTLANAPFIPSEVMVDIKDGVPAQIQGIDFLITGAVFDWGTYGLDGIIAENDIIRFAFFT